MKIVFLLCMLFFLTQAVNANTMEFGDEAYELQFAQCSENTCINEYIKPSENLFNYNDIITLHIFMGLTPEIYMSKLKDVIESNKNMFLITEYAPNCISYGIISASKESFFIEYNLFFVSAFPDNQAIKVCSFAHKYKFKGSSDFEEVLKQCQQEDAKFYDYLSKAAFPKIVTEYINKEPVKKKSKKVKQK